MTDFKKTGYLDVSDVLSLPAVPSEERTAKGPVAYIECPENIPCNPCATACPKHAITVGEPITNLPRLDEAKCTGCGICISKCPGMAIFVVDKSGEKATVSMAYEFLPYPKFGDEVNATDRSGKIVTRAKVVSCAVSDKLSRTAVLKIAVERKFADIVRGIRR